MSSKPAKLLANGFATRIPLGYAGAMRSPSLFRVAAACMLAAVCQFVGDLSPARAETLRPISAPDWIRDSKPEASSHFVAMPGVGDDNPVRDPGPGWLHWELPHDWRTPARQRRILAAGAALILLDRNTIRLFDTDRGSPNRSTDALFRPFNTAADGATLAAGLTLAWSVQRGESRETTGTALVALANSTVATTMLKGLVGKQRPDQSMEPHYRGPSLVFSSFPSGHTAAATSVAHVFARKYPRHKGFWVSFAALVAVSRVSSAKHWLSDTAWGAGIGLLSAEGALNGNGPAFRIRF